VLGPLTTPGGKVSPLTDFALTAPSWQHRLDSIRSGRNQMLLVVRMIDWTDLRTARSLYFGQPTHPLLLQRLTDAGFDCIRCA
jgi:hypothetical protein